ncbi:MAG: hypothetical protein IKK82_13460 [Kiritimatiellae bacterium]|nr:hypothetical protein [Kiritimatiellia bacterium]
MSFFAATGTLWSYQLPSLPEVSRLDAEVSTNVAFNAERSDARRFGVSMAFSGTVSNCVQVAFGHDDNGDGDLSAVETRFAIGWRGGAYFIEDVPGRLRFEEVADAERTARQLVLEISLNKDYVPKRMAASNECGACFSALSANVPSWLYGKDWNLMKVTRRGVDSISESIEVECQYKFFRIVIR